MLLLITRPFFAFRQKSLFIRGACRLTLFNWSVRLCICVTFVFFTGYESCARLISTNPALMAVGEYGLTRGTCFVARRLEVVAAVGLLRILWCVLSAAGFRVFFFSFFSSNEHGLLQG